MFVVNATLDVLLVYGGTVVPPYLERLGLIPVPTY